MPASTISSTAAGASTAVAFIASRLARSTTLTTNSRVCSMLTRLSLRPENVTCRVAGSCDTIWK